MLSELNQAVLAEDTEDRYLTAAYLHLKPHGSDCQISIALGGHPPALLRTTDNAVRPVGREGTAVGLFAKPSFTDEQLAIAAGNVLVLHTDGLTDARNSAGELADGLIERVLQTSTAQGAETLADELIDAVLRFCNGRPRDDMALLVLMPRR